MPLSSTETALCKSIERRADLLLGDLRTLVDLPTGPGGTGMDECRGRLMDRLRLLGAETSLMPGEPKQSWLYTELESGVAPPTAVCRRWKPGLARMVLCGHLDTVHASTSGFRKLEVSPDGKKATGPGCVDMKGGLVIAISALEALEERGIPVSWEFILNADEETGSFHSQATLHSEAQNGDVGLVFEPATAEGGLVISRPGSGQFMIETRGKAGHVGRDFRSCVSAVTALAKCITAVADMADVERGVITNIGPICGGSATNVVPDHAAAWGNVRYGTPEAAEELGRTLDALATADGALPAVAVRRSFHRPAKPATAGTLALAERAQAAAADLGQALAFATTGGVCDGNNLQAAGLATIDTLGARGGGLHTESEWIEVASLVDRCKLVAVLMSRLAESGVGAG